MGAWRARFRVAATAVMILCGAATRAGAADADAVWAALASGEPKVLLIRHAEAPGIGDPSGFSLDDCATQRNLSERGRAQAASIGEALRRHRVPVAKVLTSQWCRCRDTARLLDVGPVEDAPPLNSFFDERRDRTTRTEALRSLVRAWSGPGVLALVTHQVNIAALTDVRPASGEMVVLTPDSAAGFRLVGRIAAPS